MWKIKRKKRSTLCVNILLCFFFTTLCDPYCHQHHLTEPSIRNIIKWKKFNGLKLNLLLDFCSNMGTEASTDRATERRHVNFQGSFASLIDSIQRSFSSEIYGQKVMKRWTISDGMLNHSSGDKMAGRAKRKSLYLIIDEEINIYLESKATRRAINSLLWASMRVFSDILELNQTLQKKSFCNATLFISPRRKETK